MKLVGVYTSSHQVLKDRFFSPSLQDDYEVWLHPYSTIGRGLYMDKDWTQAILFKSDTIIESIRKYWGEVFVYSDMDVVFFGKTKAQIISSLGDNDLACQRDDPSGNFCAGFFAVRANTRTLRLWQMVRDFTERERRAQPALNRLVRETADLRCVYLPASSFFGPGTFTGRLCSEGDRFYVPSAPLMFHANWTIGVRNKVALLEEAQRIVRRGFGGRAINNILFNLQHGKALRTLRKRIALLRRAERCFS